MVLVPNPDKPAIGGQTGRMDKDFRIEDLVINKEDKVNIIVCLKQVPDTESQIKIGSDGKSIVTDDIKWVMNPYDEFGVEEALRLKEKHGGEVTVVGLGPKRVTESLRTALAMGADKGLLISDEALDGSDSLANAKAIAAAVKDLDYDLIFTGQRGVDDDLGLVGATIAELLGIPQLSLIVKVEVAEDVKSVKVERPIEGEALTIESNLPALITVQKGLNEPRYASLPGIMKAKKKPLEEKTLADLGLDSAEFGEGARKLKILELTPPPDRAAGKIVEGETPQEKAAELAKLLHDEAKVL
jgi:electron transfer flavoprotein beta subunit